MARLNAREHHLVLGYLDSMCPYCKVRQMKINGSPMEAHQDKCRFSRITESPSHFILWIEPTEVRLCPVA
jgi:hypothetical protein